MRAVGWVVSLFVASAAYAQASPPKGITWKTTADEGKSEASKKNVPLLIYVGDASGTSQELNKSFEDAVVQRLLAHFACVYLARDYDKTKFQQSYVPWIGATPQTTHRAPVLIFGDSKGNPRAEFRVDGKPLSVSELTAHLNKVLTALAPAEGQRSKIETLEASKLSDLLALLDTSMGVLDTNLSDSGLNAFKEELPWTETICKYVETKSSKEVKDKDAKKKVSGLCADLKKSLASLEKFKGKDPDKFKDALGKAREAQKALAEACGK
jgi:hypothetical protein